MSDQFKEVVLAAWLYNAGSVELLEAIQDCLPPEVDAGVVITLASQQTALEDTSLAFTQQLIAYSSRLSLGLSDSKTNPEAVSKQQSHRGEERAVPLINILTTLHLSEKGAPVKAFNRLQPLEEAAILPSISAKATQEEYKQHWTQFRADFKKLKGLSFRQFLPALVSLLEQYWWCIPASDQDEQDISLFQHAKLTAAFAAALYRYHTETGACTENALYDSAAKKFRLINGDMSGIQKYIFDLQIPKNNAKLLRARSFQLWALSEVCADYIIEDFALTSANIITTAGGKFLLLVHNTDKTLRHIEALQEHLETYFLKEFAGKLFFILSNGVELSALDIDKEHILRSINEVGYNAEECKQRKMQKALTKHGAVLSSLYDDLQKNGECAFCGVHPASGLDGDRPICKHCDSLKKIGERLVKTGGVVFHSNRLKDMASFEQLVEVSHEKQLRNTDAQRVTYIINKFQAGLPRINLPYTAPKEKDGTIKMFEDIVKDSAGNRKLAMFKADIDNLGLVFTSSLGARMSLARYAEMSRILHYFFSTYYAYFVEQHPYYNNKIYTVFSGGDDLCVLGAWDVILHFAYDFRQELQKLTNNNPSVTLSGGLVLAFPSLPVRNIAETAEEQLELSKDFNSDRAVQAGLVTKNAVTVFDTSVSWEDFHTYLGYGEQLAQYMNDDNLGTAPVYKLIGFANREKQVRNGNVREMVWRSNFRYTVARTIKDENATLKNLFLSFGTADSILKARIAASYALYANRKSTEEGV